MTSAREFYWNVSKSSQKGTRHINMQNYRVPQQSGISKQTTSSVKNQNILSSKNCSVTTGSENTISFMPLPHFCFVFVVVFDQCCWLLYCCWLPSHALLSSSLLSCCMQCYCEALRAQTRWGALEVLFIIIIIINTE